MIRKLLIANRGEIAVRIARTAAEMGIATVAIYSDDDARCLHVRRMDDAVALGGFGARAYLDIAKIVEIAVAAGCDAVHPGYGFLSENADFAAAIEKAGLIFVGPTPDNLRLFGDKIAAKALAADCDVACIPGTSEPTDLEAACVFFDSLPDGSAMMIKAIAGGGGRGMRAVFSTDEIAEAWERCRSEAGSAFGNPEVYVERFVRNARHLEVQIVGDGVTAIHMGERECTLQRRNQKVVEIAPSPSIDSRMRDALTNASLRMARCHTYRSLGTFEFLLDLDLPSEDGMFFIEANPRIQVEHTVTEEIHDIDLVQLQLELASGYRLADFVPPSVRGQAIQCRINMETTDAKGGLHPSSGTLTAFDPPSGRRLRVDTFGYSGYETTSSFDSLLAKLIVFSPVRGYDVAIRRMQRALQEFRIEGVATNLPYLTALFELPKVGTNEVTTRFLEVHASNLVAATAVEAKGLYFSGLPVKASDRQQNKSTLPEGQIAAMAPMQGTITLVSVREGEQVNRGQNLAILEAMKMENAIEAPIDGIIRTVLCTEGETLPSSAPLFHIEPVANRGVEAETKADIDLDRIRPDLAEVLDRLSFGQDESRTEAVAKRHARGQQTARENLAQLCDPGSFIEYGGLGIAAQRQRRTIDDLMRNTAGDGVLTGFGSINGDLFDPSRSRCAFTVYDAMVLAGTQGQTNHRKQDRLFKQALKWKVPVVLLGEGGGGRPGDTDRAGVAGLDTKTFGLFASLSGKVPLVSVVSGRCFAGNAGLVGCSDVIIATENSNIGMAGPAMIEGGGLGLYRPEEIGPIDVQTRGGVVDIRVKDEAEACDIAKRYLSYFQGTTGNWTASDQRILRHVIPENRLRVYDVRKVIDGLADDGSVLELRPDFGIGILTTFIRIEGRPFGLIANNNRHLGGAIDGPAADKAARFMQLCDAYGLPIISLCDTPGFMVGPEAEGAGLVRHVCRMFVTGASLSVPIFGIALRKSYGLGAIAMFGGGFHESFFTIAWPTGEFGGMGLEGAVRLGFKKELEALTDPTEKQALFDKLLAGFYDRGKALHIATAVEIDAVIDPIDTRHWILRGYDAMPPEALSPHPRPFIDPC